MGYLHNKFEEISCECLVGKPAPFFGEIIKSVTCEPIVVSGEFRSPEKIGKRGDICLHTENHNIYFELVHKNPISKEKVQKYIDSNIDAITCTIEAKNTTDPYPKEYIKKFLCNIHNYTLISRATPFEIEYNGESLVFDNAEDYSKFFGFTCNGKEYLCIKQTDLTSCEKRIIKRQGDHKTLITIPGYDSHKLIKENLAISNKAISFR